MTIFTSYESIWMAEMSLCLVGQALSRGDLEGNFCLECVQRWEGGLRGLTSFSLPDDGQCGGEESALIDPIRMESTIVEVHLRSPAQDLHGLTPPDGFEPSTDCLEGSCSIQLS